jgi:hypothetical protein
MDSQRPDPDDDVTIVGDHELVTELRRLARDVAAGSGAPPPPPPPARPTAPGVAGPGAAASAPSANPPPGRPERRRAAEAWDDDYRWGDEEQRDGSRLAWIVLALVVAAAVVGALLVLR